MSITRLDSTVHNADDIAPPGTRPAARAPRPQDQRPRPHPPVARPPSASPPPPPPRARATQPAPRPQRGPARCAAALGVKTDTGEGAEGRPAATAASKRASSACSRSMRSATFGAALSVAGMTPP